MPYKVLKPLRVAIVCGLLTTTTVACSNTTETTANDDSTSVADITTTTGITTTSVADSITPLLQIAVDPKAGELPTNSSTSTTTDESTTTTTADSATSTAKETTTSAANQSTTAKPSTTAAPSSTTKPKATTATTAAPAPQKAPANGHGYVEGNTSVDTSHFPTLSPGTPLPTGEWCAKNVRSAPEVRQVNVGPNQVRGTKPNSKYPRVDGNFTGTTDEIIQWTACKWGIDENIVRAQAVVESWWDQNNGGDPTSDKSKCHPAVRDQGSDCPESLGLLQIRWSIHKEAYEDDNARLSTAYNIDYVFGKWRECYEGRVHWLNTVERGKEYGAGDLWGCIGVWYAGRWHTNGAADYIATVKRRMNNKRWAQSDFLGYDAWLARQEGN